MNKEKRKKQDIAYLKMAKIWGELSYCKRKKVGALIVKDRMIISDGFNGTPSGFENISINWFEIMLAIIISALAAFGALSLMMRLLTTVNFTPYVLYRILLGSLLIIWAIM